MNGQHNETCPRRKKKRAAAVLKVIIPHFQSDPVYMLTWAFQKSNSTKSTNHKPQMANDHVDIWQLVIMKMDSYSNRNEVTAQVYRHSNFLPFK